MSPEYEMSEEIRGIVDKCEDPARAGQVVRWLAGRCEEEGIRFPDYGWKSLVNHVAAMVNRSVSGEVLEIDPELFEDVGAQSLSLSREVVEAVGGIDDSEKYLLSIHFESAKENA